MINPESLHNQYKYQTIHQNGNFLDKTSPNFNLAKNLKLNRCKSAFLKNVNQGFVNKKILFQKLKAQRSLYQYTNAKDVAKSDILYDK